MRTIRAIALAGLLVPMLALAAGKSIPYASSLYQDSDWTTVNANGDAKTWTDDNSSTNFSGSGFTHGIKYSYNGSLPGDDWYISPAITLEAGKEYKVKFWEKTGSYDESLDLRVANAGTVDALTAGTVLVKLENHKSNKGAKQIATFTPETSGDYYFGFYCYSQKDKYYQYVTGFEIDENVFRPASVSALTVTPGADRALTATLSWALPTTDNDGVALAEDASFDEIIISRDGRVVANIAGDLTEWIDDATHGLTSGKHTYEVIVVVNGTQSAPASVDSKYIGPIEAMTLPYNAGIGSMTQEDFELFWTPVKGRNSTSTANWQFKTSSYYGNSIQYCGGSSKVQDDWVISPEMTFAEPGVYRLKVKLAYSSSTKTDFDILLGTGASIGGYETVIKNLTSIPSSDTDYEIFFEVTEPGNYGIALHAHGEPSYSTYDMRNFEVEKWKLTPAHVNDLTVSVADDGTTVNLAWTNPAKSNTGAELTALDKVEVYCNDALIETYTEAAPGAAMTLSHTPATAGVHTYHVLAYTAEGPADGEPVKVTSTWVGDETQPLPYTTSFAANDATTPIWSGYSAGSGDTPWTIGTSAKIAKPSDYVKTNDYLLSPYFDLKPGYYTVTYSIKGAGKNFTLSVGTVSDKKDVAATFVGGGSIKLPGQSWQSDYTTTLKVDTEGKYAVALWANDYMSSSDYALEVTKFTAAYQPVYPGLATDITITPAADLSNSATISWTNPSTTNIEGIDPVIVKAEIIRDGERVGEVTEGLEAGKVSSFVDTLPNAGEYTYSVAIHGTEGASTDKLTEVKSPWIGAGLDLPFSCADSFRDAGWTIFNLNNDSNNWGPITWEAGGSNISITSNNNTPDDWAITPRLNFTAGTLYEIVITSGYSTGYQAVDWDLHHGTSVDPAAMTTKIATVSTTTTGSNKQTDTYIVAAVDPAAAALLADDATEDSYVRIPAGVGTIGLHANNKGAFGVYAFEVKEYKPNSIDAVFGDNAFAVVGSTLHFGATAQSVAVADIAGRIVKSENGVESIDVDGLASGIYVVSANVNGKQITVKIAK